MGIRTTMKKTHTNGNDEITSNPCDEGKKAYIEPTLMVYGTVRGLTASGTGTKQEAANSGGQSNPKDPQKRP